MPEDIIAPHSTSRYKENHSSQVTVSTLGYFTHPSKLPGLVDGGIKPCKTNHANIKLASVVSDIHGQSAQEMIQHLIQNDLNHQEMADLAKDASGASFPS